MNWETKKISDFARVRGGKRIPKGKGVVDFNTGRPYLRVTDLSPFGVDAKNIKFIEEDVFQKIKRYTISQNEIYISNAGTIGLVGIVPSELDGVSLTENCAKLTSIADSVVNQTFLCYYLRSPEGQGKLLSKVGGASQPKLALTRIGEIEIPLPPLPTQQKIAAILSAYDDLIENNLRRIRLLEEAAQHLYREWFVQLRFPGWQDVPVVDGQPVGWERRRADEIFDISIGKTPPRNEPEWFVDGNSGIKWVSIRDMNASGAFLLETSEGITTEGVQKFNINVAPQGTVILSFKLTIGALAIASEDMVTNEAIAHFKIPSGATVSNYFTYCYLKNFNYETLGSTSSIGSALNSKMVKAIPFVVTESETSQLFDRTAEAFFNQIKNLLLQNQRLKEARDLLLPRLMSGALAV